MFAEFTAIAIRKLDSLTVGSYVVQEEEAIGRGSEPERHVAIDRIEFGRSSRSFSQAVAHGCGSRL